MDDIASELSISKKTIYAVFRDKESLFCHMVDYCFDRIKESEAEVLANPKLDTVQKIHAILGVLPEGYKEIDFRQLYQLKEKYPTIYRRVEQRLENGWEMTIELITRGIEEGSIRPVKIAILKTMLESTLEQFFQRDTLIVNEISYQEALDEAVEIIVNGITVKQERK